MIKKAPKPIPAHVLESVATALRVLAHPGRLRIVELLEGGDLTVGELAARLDLSPAACSQHLNLMRAHGLLISRREGRTVFYQLDHPAGRMILQCIRDHAV